MLKIMPANYGLLKKLYWVVMLEHTPKGLLAWTLEKVVQEEMFGGASTCELRVTDTCRNGFKN